MPDFKIVISDPEAPKVSHPVKVKVVGADIEFGEKEKEGFALPKAKLNKKTYDAIAPRHNVITIRVRKQDGGKVNLRFMVEIDDSVPDNTIQVPGDLLGEKLGASEVEGEAFRSHAWQIRISGDTAKPLIGMRIGDEIDGAIVGLKGYKLVIRGGSDNSGFPMRPDIRGGVKKRVLLSGPPGFWPREKGERRRKIVRGDTITEDIVQINVAIRYPEEKKG